MDMTDAEILAAALEGTLQDIDATHDDSAQGTAVTTANADDATPATTDTEQDTGATPEAEHEGAPILSKSGNYTIPYEKLTEARAERDALREQVAQLNSQIAGLTAEQRQNLAAANAEAQARADDTGQKTQADANLDAATQAMAQGVDVAIFGDFSEQDLAKGVAELSRRAIEQVRTEFDAKLQSALAPLREKEAVSAADAHDAAILQAHPDAFEIAEAAEFKAWRTSLPAFARAGVEKALDSGTAQEVIEVLDAFRGTVSTKPQQQQPNTQRAAPEAQRPRVPNSLSEVPGAAPVDETQQALAMAGNSAALLDRMGSMTADQLDALMNRI